MSNGSELNPVTGDAAANAESKTQIEPADLLYETRVPGRETDRPPAIAADQYATRAGGVETMKMPALAQPDWPTVDGYEILGELGRGGMGVVYRARQVNLNRLVALKMIRTGPSASQEELRRFRIEAETIARLQHPNIVQLFEVREQKGEAFLALELIEGASLNRNIEAPWPAPQAARLLETLARAIHYAHEQGIVHRDLKPANILLNRVSGNVVSSGVVSTVHKAGETMARQEGPTVHRLPFLARQPGSTHMPAQLAAYQPKITDFGLAKLMSADSAGPTVSGEFLGTPTYSAPEQASGKLRDIGPHTDVYALGVILYELLTGRPPFHGATILDTLDQVRSQEPVPPSRLQKRVPRDLETICLKCLQKSPQRRYPSALLLAEDLHAYLHGRPIQARPVSMLERVYKWTLRHPASATCIGLGAVTVVALLVGSWLYAAAMTDAAQRETKLRQEAEDSLGEAVNAVEHMLTRVGDVDLADVPQLEGVRKKLLADAQSFYEKFLKQHSTSAEIRFLAGRAKGRLGDIHEMLDESAAAERSYLEAQELLAETSAKSARQQAELARVCNHLGVLLKRLGRLPAAEKSLRESLELRQQAVDAAPKQSGYLQDLAASWYDLGTVLARLPRQQEKAESAYREALRIQEDLCKSQPDDAGLQRERARTLNNMGKLFQNMKGKQKEAAASFQQAVEIHAKVVQKHPSVPQYSRELAWSYNNLAGLRRITRKTKEAEKIYAKGLKLLKHLAADFPTVPVYRQDLAGTYYDLGLLYQETGEFDKADEAYRDALTIREKVVNESPNVPDYQDGLAKVHIDVGRALEKRGALAGAEQHYREAITLLEKIATAAGRPAYQSDLAFALGHQGNLLFGRSNRLRVPQGLEEVLRHASVVPPFPALAAQRQAFLFETLACLNRAVSYQRAAWKADKQNVDFPAALYEHYKSLTVVQWVRRDHEGLAQSSRAFPEIFPGRSDSYVTAAKCLALAMPLAAADDRLSPDIRRETAERYARASIEMLRKAVAHGFSNANELKRLPVFEPLRQRPEFRRIIQDLEDTTPQNA